MSVGQFEVLSVVGEGAYSQVFRVRRRKDMKMYALKKVKIHALSDKERLNSLNEVRLLASINHPNIISYKEAFIDDEKCLWYFLLSLVMEYADGGDLYQRILEYQQKARYMSESFIWMIAVQLCQALAHLHSLNILHRDIKSANVFMSSEGVVKLGDLNVSKVAKDGLLRTQTGTPYYASPEVWRDMPYDGRSDVWSLGCVLYEAAALKPPFRAEDMQGLYRKVVKGEYPRIPRGYSNDLVAFLDTMLQVDPSRRLTSAQLLLHPILCRRAGKYEDITRDKGVSSLLNTILFPKSLKHMSERLPAANYQEELKHNASEPVPFKLNVGTNLPRITPDIRDDSAGRSRLPRKGSVERVRIRDHSDPASQIRILRENYGALKQVKAKRQRTGTEREDSKSHEMSLDSIMARRGASSTGRRMSRQPADSKRLQLLRLLQLDSSSRRLLPS